MAAIFAFPTTIVFASGSVGELRGRLAALGATRPLVVTDPGFCATRAFDAARAVLPDGCVIFSDVQGNPTEANAEAAATAFREQRCDGIVGLGGGSALDVAKIIRLRAKLPHWSFRDAIPVDEVIDELAPFIAIPTTAGTGSEVGRSSVLTIDGHKRVIFHPSLLADAVLLDPVLTVELPPKLTAATGADALTHCIESFASPVFHPLCDGIALEGVRLIARALPRAVEEPGDLDARGTMLVAATMGGIAFQKDLGAAHSLAHPLSALCGLHHGLANALVLPAVMRFNARRKPELYYRVGLAMGKLDTVAGVTGLLREIGIVPGLRAAGVRDDQLEALADQAFADACHLTNPVPVTRDDLLQLYREAM
ncbi:MAG TPA: iron-containing alcohol dehydrogenase [Tepidisphaeraceae bacterium]|nr:iron-containing alcohol dehydrogenase [Tepidisphaeraceae bacterium]